MLSSVIDGIITNQEDSSRTTCEFNEGIEAGEENLEKRNLSSAVPTLLTYSRIRIAICCHHTLVVVMPDLLRTMSEVRIAASLR